MNQHGLARRIYSVLLLSCCAQAQTTMVAGTVSDPSGAIVQSAVVTITCGALEHSTKSSSAGAFSIAAEPGACRMTVDAAGFEPAARDVVIRAGEAPAPQNIRLTVAHAASEVSVVAEGGYIAVNESTSAKTAIPVLETPQAISVITHEQLAERGVQTLTEALRYTPGVAVETWGADSRFDYFMIRGFTEEAYGSFRDGLRWPSELGRLDPYGVEEVDVLKGPSSVLYGQNAPGGLVNLVTKQPPRETTGEIGLVFGAYDQKQVQTDFGGPLDEANLWRYRFTGLSRWSDTQVDYTPDERVFVAPALTWQPSAKTTVTIMTDYQRDRTRWSQFLPAQGTLLYNPNGVIPVSFFASEPGFDRVHRFQYSGGYQLVHRRNDTWTFRQNLRHSFAAYDGATAYGIGLEPDLRSLDRAAYTWNSGARVTAVDTQAEARVRTGFLRHTLLAGFDYLHFNTETRGQFGSAGAIDAFQPVYGGPIGPLATYTDTHQPSSQSGVYIQDQLKLGQGWVVLLSGRQDWTHARTRDLLAASTTRQEAQKFTGRAGVVYTSSIGLAPYFSYSTSFLPVIGVDYFGRPYRPTAGQQEEAGLRFQPRRWNSFLSASAFNLKQQNVQTPDPTNPLNTIQTGEVRVRGAEVEAVAALFAGWNLHLAYTRTNARVTRTTVIEEQGMHPTQVPDQYASALTEYTVPRGPFAGFGGGAGVRYIGVSAADMNNSMQVPGYTLYDASLHFDWNHTRFDVNATNLTDRRYIAVCTGLSYCNFGYARNVIGTVRYHW